MDSCREGHFLVLADEPAVDVAVVGKKQRVAAFPGDGEGLPAKFYRIKEVKVGIQVVDRFA